MKKNMFKMRKRLRYIFLWMLVLLCLAGCGSIGGRARVLQGRMEIPENGIVTEDIFRQLQEENGVITFTGVSSDIAYEWTIFGSDLENCKDCNLAVSIEKTDSQELILEYLSEENYGFSAVLSIYLNELWNAESAVVTRIDETQETVVCTASITGNENSILNFPVENPVGKYAVTSLVNAYESEGEVVTGVEKEADVLEPADTEEVDVLESADTEEASYLSAVADETKEIMVSKESTVVGGAKAGTEQKDAEKESSGNRVISDGKGAGKDEYLTDPIPQGKPMPVEPDDQQVDESKSYTCTFSIECSSILNRLEDLEEEKLDEVPSGGTILKAQKVTFYDGESVYDVLRRVCRENGIQMEASWTPIYNSAYVEGIHNLYEFDCGSGSGWMYRVNGWYPNYGCSRYQLKDGEVVEWRYTCNLGKDIGGSNAIGN